MNDPGTLEEQNASTRAGPDAGAPAEQALEQEPYELLRRLEDWLETPLLVLGFAWLGRGRRTGRRP